MAVTWLHASLLIPICLYCREQHADVNIWSIPLFFRFSGLPKIGPNRYTKTPAWLYAKELHTTMSGPFYSDAKTVCDFSGTIEDTDIINTPLEPLPPAGFVDIAPHLEGEIPQNLKFWGVNRRFQAKRPKY